MATGPDNNVLEIISDPDSGERNGSIGQVKRGGVLMRLAGDSMEGMFSAGWEIIGVSRQEVSQNTLLRKVKEGGTASAMLWIDADAESLATDPHSQVSVAIDFQYSPVVPRAHATMLDLGVDRASWTEQVLGLANERGFYLLKEPEGREVDERDGGSTIRLLENTGQGFYLYYRFHEEVWAGREGNASSGYHTVDVYIVSVEKGNDGKISVVLRGINQGQEDIEGSIKGLLSGLSTALGVMEAAWDDVGHLPRRLQIDKLQ